MNMKELLKGKSFKRNKYGLSNWTQIVTDVEIHYKLMGNGWIPVFKIRGDLNDYLYDLDEIIFIGVSPRELKNTDNNKG